MAHGGGGMAVRYTGGIVIRRSACQREEISMRRARKSAVALVAMVLVAPIVAARAQAGTPETARAVAGGGISVAGWAGKIDAGQAGVTLADARLTKEGDALHVATRPPPGYCNPSNTPPGNYNLKATAHSTPDMNP